MGVIALMLNLLKYPSIEPARDTSQKTDLETESANALSSCGHSWHKAL